MSQKIAEINDMLTPHGLASNIVALWDKHSRDRRVWLDQKMELRNYLFATDTTTTSNSNLPWKNKTTLPKLTQIRDNLHANYMSALFPNDEWLKWEGHSKDSVIKSKASVLTAYMLNKCRMSNFATTVSQLLYDYIDFGNAIYDTVWVKEVAEDAETGEQIPGYIGPKLVRISPLDIVFNPQAADFDSTYKITRYVKTMGELHAELDNRPEMQYNSIIVNDSFNKRGQLSQYTPEDINKAVAYQVDGFGSLAEYYGSGLVEILEFEGSIYDKETQTFKKNRLISVIDRCQIARDVQMPSWLGKSSKGHVSWRQRPDNLYGMGPLDNLVGLQYRIDHLENLKADAMDLAVQPPLVIAGNVEEFTYQPGAEIFVGEGGAVTELGKNLQGVIGASNEIANIEAKMEEMAGAPKQAMGIRTPGEKTAYEVQSLEMAASRIFQHRITYFELNLLEPALNKMLEVARRNIDGTDLIRVVDDDIGAVDFLSVTKTDITASGKLRPTGARHFAAQAVRMQNLMGLVNSNLFADQGVRVHMSGKGIAKMVEEMLDLHKFDIVQDNIQVFESLETAQMQSQAQEELEVTDMTPSEAPQPLPEEGAV